MENLERIENSKVEGRNEGGQEKRSRLRFPFEFNSFQKLQLFSDESTIKTNNSALRSSQNQGWKKIAKMKHEVKISPAEITENLRKKCLCYDSITSNST